MLNLFKLPLRRRNSPTFGPEIPPDLTIMLVRSLTRRLEYFNDAEIEGAFEKITDELALLEEKIKTVPEDQHYEILAATLRKIEGDRA